MSEATRRSPALRHSKSPGPQSGGGGPPPPSLDSCLENLSSWRPFTGEEGGADTASPHFLGTESGLSSEGQTGASLTLNGEALARHCPPDGAAQRDPWVDRGSQWGQGCEASPDLLPTDREGLAKGSLGACSQGSPASRRTGKQNDTHRGVPSSLQSHPQTRQKPGFPRGKQASDAVPSGQSVPTPLPPSSPRPPHHPHHRGSRSSAVPRFLSQKGMKNSPGGGEAERSVQVESSQGSRSSIMQPLANTLDDSARKGGERRSRGTELVTSLSSEPKSSPLFCRIRLPGERRPKGSKDAGSALRKVDTGRKHSPRATLGVLEPLHCALSSGDEAMDAAATSPGLHLHSEEAGDLSTNQPTADIVVPATAPGGTAGKLILEETDIVFEGMDASQPQKPQLGSRSLLGRAGQAPETREEASEPRAPAESHSNLMGTFSEGNSREGGAGPGLLRQQAQDVGSMAASTALANPKQVPGSRYDAALVGSAQQQEKSFQFGQPASNHPLSWRFFALGSPGREGAKANGSKSLLPSWPDRSQLRRPANPSAQVLRSPRRLGAGHAGPSPAAATRGRGSVFGAPHGSTAEAPSSSQGYLPTGSKRANTEVAEDMNPGSSYEAEVSDYSEEERAERQRVADLDPGLAAAGPGSGLRFLEGMAGATSGSPRDAVGGSERAELPGAGAPRSAPGDAMLPTSQLGGLEEGLWQGITFSQGTPRRPRRTSHQPRKRRRCYTGGYTSSEGLSVQGSERLGMAYASDPATDHASHGREGRMQRRGLVLAPGSSSGGADQAYYYTRSRSGRAKEAARRRGGAAASRGSVRGSGGYISSSSTGLDLPKSRHRLRSEQWYAMNWQSGAESECGSDVGYGGDGELGEGCEEDPIEEGDENAGEAARPAHTSGNKHMSPPKAHAAAQASQASAMGQGLVKKLRWPRAGEKEKEKEKEKERQQEAPAAGSPHVRRRMHLLDQVREGHSGPEASPAADKARKTSDAQEDVAQQRWRLPSRILVGEGSALPRAVPSGPEHFARGPATLEVVAEALRQTTFRSNSAAGASERESSGPSFTVRGGRGIRRAYRPTRVRRKRRSSRNFGPQASEGAAGPFPEFDPWRRGPEFAAPGSGSFSLSPWTAFDGRRPFKAFGWGGGSGYEQEEDGEGESGRESILGQGGSEPRDTPIP